MDHSLFEPISGLFEEHYVGSPVLSENMSCADALVAARRFEEIVQKSYVEAGERISFIPTVSRLYTAARNKEVDAGLIDGQVSVYDEAACPEGCHDAREGRGLLRQK